MKSIDTLDYPLSVAIREFALEEVREKEENLKQAQRYWENKENPQGERGIVEMLVDGDIEVVEIVKEVVLEE